MQYWIDGLDATELCLPIKATIFLVREGAVIIEKIQDWIYIPLKWDEKVKFKQNDFFKYVFQNTEGLKI